MKYFLVMAMLASPALADSPEASVSFSNGAFSGSVGYEAGDLSELKAGVTYAKHDFGKVSTQGYTGILHDFDMDQTKIVNDFRVNYRFSSKFGNYAILNVDYVFDDTEALIVGPTYGAYYAFADNFSSYADVSVFYDALDGFDYLGGEIGGGVSYGLNDTTWLTVGFTRPVDVDWEVENSVYVNTSFVF